MSARRSGLRVWLQLFRAPNLFTVPGDPAAGYLLVHGGEIDRGLPLAITASLCLYGAGLLMNDLADEAEDLRERPNRPLPSGAVDRVQVRWVMVGLCLAALGALALTGRLSALVVGVGVIASVATYNWVTKSWPVVGALNMGLCRSGSVLLGIYATTHLPTRLSILAAVGFGLFIAAVTNLARHETRAGATLLARLLPGLVALLISAIGTYHALSSPRLAPAAAALYLLAAGVVGWLCWKMLVRPTPLPPLIGAHIRALLLYQAATCALAALPSVSLCFALVLLALWPISRSVGRVFYAS